MVWTKSSMLLMVAIVGSYGAAGVRPSVPAELADPSIIVGQAAQAGSRCLRSVSYQVTFPCLMAASASGVSRSAATTAWARLAGESRQVPGVAQGAASVVLPAGERRFDSDVVDLAAVAVAGPEYYVGVLEALQVLRRDARGVVGGCEAVEVVVVQLFLQLAVDDCGQCGERRVGPRRGRGSLLWGPGLL